MNTCHHMEGISGLGCDCEWQQFDDLAHDLANKNEVELCWMLRGMNDRANDGSAAGQQLRCYPYHGYYVAGWNSVQPGDVLTEQLAREALHSNFGM